MVFGPRSLGEVDRALVSRGSKSRNKVSVGEPAEGSVMVRGFCYLLTDGKKERKTKALGFC